MWITSPVVLIALILYPILISSDSNVLRVKKQAKSCSTRRVQNFQKTGKVLGYYPSYNYKLQSLRDINYTLYTDLLFFVAVPYENFTFIFEDMKGQNGTELALSFSHEAKSHNVTPILSFGGWIGSRFFSNLTIHEEKRNKLAFEMVKFTKKLGYLGIDLDWEHPNADGIGCNSRNPMDTQNLGLLVKEIRRLWPVAQLTAAIDIRGLIGKDSGPATLEETHDLVNYLDYVNIMAYDVNGAWSHTSGPLAPISSKCSPPENAVSVESSFKVFTSQGFKPSQLLLGIPAYGRGFGLASPDLRAKNVEGIKTYYYQKTTSVTPPGGISDDKPGVDVCGNHQGYGGIWLVKELISNGWLSPDQRTAQKGFTRHFDECSGMPFITDKKILISYDDQYSTIKKVEFAKSRGMAGVFFFDTQGAPDTTVRAARDAM